MMTREDMLRELELLPVWQLRVPLPTQPEVPQLEPELPQTITSALEAEAELVTLTCVEALPINAEQVAVELAITQAVDAASALQVEELMVAEPQLFTHIASDDGVWLFVLPNTTPQADEARLLQNIFIAMRIKAKPAEISAGPADVIKNNQPKLVIAMGEAAAQAILQSAETLASLRSKLHSFQGTTLVATYDLTHLLDNLPDKAKAWEDFCLAMRALQNLQ